MNTLSRKLPVGIQTFEKLREEGCLYVDKTALVWQLASTATPYFLSRPRRFGKSLLISTFESYFQGRKDLFEGLAIEKLETEWTEHPILHLDLNAEKYESPERLNYIIERHLNIWEDTWGGDERETTLSDRFNGIIRRAYEQTGRGVVVLIDGYDEPMQQVLPDKKLFVEFNDTLMAFYGVLKSADRYLRFVFLTGIAKIAQEYFSGNLNQLQDISMRLDYAEVCGITKEELVEVFTPELETLGQRNGLTLEETVEKMTAMYDGYHFSEFAEGMLNPFSVLNALKSGKFECYWFQMGTPAHWVNMLKERNYDLRRFIDGVEVGVEGFSQYHVDANNLLPMFYQSGYLTIKGYDKRFRLYTLAFPNHEIRYGFEKFMSDAVVRICDDADTTAGKNAEDFKKVPGTQIELVKAIERSKEDIRAGRVIRYEELKKERTTWK